MLIPGGRSNKKLVFIYAGLLTIASNRHHLTKIATAEVKVPASH